MSLWHIAWNYLWSRKMTTSLTILSVALGVGLIAAVHSLRAEVERRFAEEGQAFDIVVGAKGSRLQLVLSCVYFIGDVAGNIPYSLFEQLKQDEDVSAAFPIGLGDTYKGFRIVGTVPELMHHKWIVDPISGRERTPFQLAGGRFFEKPFEAVVGSVVAQQTGLQVGDTLVSTHGFGGHSHDISPYTVVGILKPGGTPNDRAIFSTLDSVWEIHGQHEHHEGEEEQHEGEAAAESSQAHAASMLSLDDEDNAAKPLEVTAVLINLKSPALRFTFFEKVNDSMNAMAAIPVNEVQTFFNSVLETVKMVLLAVAYLVVVTSALTIMIGLYLSILQRRHDLAVMRALGASHLDIFGAVILEAFLVTLLGVCAGWLLGNVVSYALGIYMTNRFGMNITAFGLSNEEMKSFCIVALVGLFAGIMPAWQAYQTDVARDLNKD